MKLTRYLELDSTYRDRTRYSIVGQFEVAIQRAAIGVVNGLTATDPILDAYPYYPTTLPSIVAFAGGTAALPQLDANASAVPNFYINSVLQDITLNEYRIITAYNGLTRVATLDTAFSGGWAVVDTYQIRRAQPTVVGVIAGAPTRLVVELSAGVQQDDFYNGYYIWMTSGPAINEVRRIQDYTSLRVATVGPAFTVAPVATNSFEILGFTRDNHTPTSFFNNSNSQGKMSLFEIELMSLTLPNVNLSISRGGRITAYPYVYIELYNTASADGRPVNIMCSNNPNSARALFRVPITDSTDYVNSSFLQFTGSKVKQIVRFNPNDNFLFSVILPDGSVFTTITDNVSPLQPNADLQISGCFLLTPIEK